MWEKEFQDFKDCEFLKGLSFFFFASSSSSMQPFSLSQMRSSILYSIYSSMNRKRGCSDVEVLVNAIDKENENGGENGGDQQIEDEEKFSHPSPGSVAFQLLVVGIESRGGGSFAVSVLRRIIDLVLFSHVRRALHQRQDLRKANFSQNTINWRQKKMKMTLPHE